MCWVSKRVQIKDRLICKFHICIFCMLSILYIHVIECQDTVWISLGGPCSLMKGRGRAEAWADPSSIKGIYGERGENIPGEKALLRGPEMALVWVGDEVVELGQRVHLRMSWERVLWGFRLRFHGIGEPLEVFEQRMMWWKPAFRKFSWVTVENEQEEKVDGLERPALCLILQNH